jgi:hypothetical protein
MDTVKNKNKIMLIMRSNQEMHNFGGAGDDACDLSFDAYGW